LFSKTGLEILNPPGRVFCWLNTLETVRRKRRDRQEIAKRFMGFLHYERY